MTASEFSDAELFSEAVQKSSQSFLAATELEAGTHPLFILSSLLTNQLHQWQIMSDYASMKGLSGVVDTLDIFCEVLVEIIALDDWLEEDKWEFLDTWYSYAELFFSYPESNAAEQWLACLNDLEPEDIEVLQAALVNDAEVLFASNDSKPLLDAGDGLIEPRLKEVDDIEKLDTAAAMDAPDLPVEPLLVAEDKRVIGRAPDMMPTPVVDVKLVGLIRAEFSLFILEFIDSIGQGIEQSSEDYQSALDNKQHKLDNLYEACDTVGLLGLKNIFRYLKQLINKQPDEGFDAQLEARLFKSIGLLIQDYLNHIGSPEKVQQLLDFLQMQGWRSCLSLEESEQWGVLLRAEITGQDKSVTSRIIITESDISLTIASDVNPELLEAIMHELPLLTEKFSKAIQNIVGENGHCDYLREAQCIAHTLKGTSGMVGVKGIATLTHNLEDILEKLTNEQKLPSKALAEVLLESVDCLEGMSESLVSSGVAPENTLDIMQSISDWHYQIAKEGVPEDDAYTQSLVKTSQNTQPSRTEAPVPTVEPIEYGAKTSVPLVLIDDLMQSMGEQGIVNEQLKEKTGGLIKGGKQIGKMTWQLHELSSEIDRLINIQNYELQKNNQVNSEFDSLEMDQYNEFHSYVHRLSEVTADIREMNSSMSRELIELKSMLQEQKNRQKESLETVQEIRLTPVQTIVSRCQRIVRQTAKVVNKNIELTILGKQTLIDNETLNRLAEPLMHLLRNSVDHGIESNELRKSRNKNEQGQITLSFTKQGDFVHVECRDDGGGLDQNKIIATAIKKGIITEADIENISANELNRLILTPGFSTNEISTQISGRGIGMDIIHSQVKAMKGLMEISSIPQKGLVINITLPLLLTTTRSILVNVGDTVFAIAEHGVKQIFSAVDAQIINKKGERRYLYEEKSYEVDQLEVLLRLGLGWSGESEVLSKPALLIEGRDGKKIALVVDAILGDQDLIVKALGDYVPDLPGILGAAILGSGEVATVLDAYELLTVQHEMHFALDDSVMSEPIRALLKVLVVDDSLSARKAAAQLMRDNGFDVETAIDGLDALAKIEKNMPDLLLLDMEMPRMNGIELATHMRAREDIGRIPIIMITSRSTEKHREQARLAGVNEYLTKPFTDDELMLTVNEVLADLVVDL